MKNNLIQTIGNTPIIYLQKYSQKYNAEIFIKLESTNPGASIKDRIAKQMIIKALQNGNIKEGGTIIEPTSGNTGIGLALCSNQLGLKTILVMPESMSLERRKLLKAYGAELVLTESSKGMTGAGEKAKELIESTPNSFMLDQFSNPECVNVHYETTAPEIENFLLTNSIKLNAFISGVGSSGTISGIGTYFKEKYKSIEIIALEPSTSAVLSGEEKGAHGIQGIGAGFVPKNFKKEVVDEIYKISTEDAIQEAKELMRIEGISCGISTGANMVGVIEYSKKNPKKTILTIAPDSAEKYLSTGLFTS